jgi:hypothetical protein
MLSTSQFLLQQHGDSRGSLGVAVTAGGASVGQACCSSTGPGGHRGAEGASEQAPMEVEEVVRQQIAPASKLP